MFNIDFFDIKMKGINMDSFETFIKIVENGSISKTADEMGYSQSSISHMLLTLENDLGCRLLSRDRNGVRLTGDGMELMPYFIDICNARSRLKEKIDALHGLETGKIRIGTFTSVSNQWLPYIIREFNIKYPNIEFELMPGSYADIEAWINAGHVDCGFLRIPTTIPLKTYFLKEDPFYAIIPTQHKFFNNEQFTMEMLANEPFIWLEDSSDHDTDQIFNKYGYKPKIRFTAYDNYTVMSMVKVGLGITLLPALAAEGYEQVLRKPLNVKATRKIGIGVTEKPSAATIKFVAHVRAWIDKKYHLSEM